MEFLEHHCTILSLKCPYYAFASQGLNYTFELNYMLLGVPNIDHCDFVGRPAPINFSYLIGVLDLSPLSPQPLKPCCSKCLHHICIDGLIFDSISYSVLLGTYH